MGRRVSIQLTSGLLNSLLWTSAISRFLGSAELDFGVGLEGVGREGEVRGSRPVPHASGRVVLAAVARTEPTAPLATRISRFVSEGHATEMGADADQHDPL